MELLLFTANCVGNQGNCFYPQRTVISNAEELKEAVKWDHVCAEYRGDRRSIANFMNSVVVVMDCDNDHSDKEEDWFDPEKMEAQIPDVAYAVTYSRHNWKQKGKKTPRPRFHVYFRIRPCSNAEEYKELKEKIYQLFPLFDDAALDAARFIYGADTEEVIWHDGLKTIDEYVKEMKVKTKKESEDVIPEGSRNNTLSRFAAKVLTRYGNCEKAHNIFMEKAAKCEPPMEESELSSIWKSATKFFEKKVKNQEGYVSPENYDSDFGTESLRPEDYSDIGQAKVLTREYGSELCYTPATDYLRFNGDYWVESKQQAVGAMEEFLDLQLADAQDQLQKAQKKINMLGISVAMQKTKSQKLIDAMDEEQMEALQERDEAAAYIGFVMRRRDMKYITSALQAAKPMLEVMPSQLDADPFLLNTPDGTYVLTKGITGAKAKEAADLITKQTACSPGEKGKDIWLDALNLFFCNDQELIDYVQMVVGMAVIGKVCIEALIIAYGGGRNGKSTFWNAISRVLGSYSGGISADALTVGCKRNVKPEMAELKGKRLVIAAELEEGMRLNTSVVKQLCSTDEICAEKKYKDPFRFIPSHMIVLYTNHLPKVGATDDGTWRRLIVIPFNAKIEGNSDIKNYADYLVQNAGPYIMSWIIEGARKVIEREYKIPAPASVKAAIKSYRENNDWLGSFLEECCEEDSSYVQKSGEFYQEYRNYCARTGDYTRSTTDFYSALELAGFERKKARSGMMIYGVRVRTESDFED